MASDEMKMNVPAKVKKVKLEKPVTIITAAAEPVKAAVTAIRTWRRNRTAELKAYLAGNKKDKRAGRIKAG